MQMKLKRIFLGILAGWLVLTSVSSLASEAKIAENNIYTDEKLNISIDSAHPSFQLKLKSNPTTGYSWYLREYDANVIVPVKHVFIKANDKLIGAPGFEIWTFKVKPIGFTVPQQTTIRLIYARPWQGAEGSTQVVFRVSTVGK